ncbi:MAG: c-type cytochrome [Pseudomonadales bacterium]
MIKQRLLIAFCLISPLTITASQSIANETGQALYGPCAACHGAKGEGNTELKGPALAGQEVSYLQRQLQHFKSGVRGADPKDTLGAQMRGMAATLVDEQAINDVSAYIAALPAIPTTDKPKGDLRNGNNQYQAACGACHGGKAEGNPLLNAPRLNILGASYIKTQYQNFQQGIRGQHPDDRFGKQMAMMADSLPGDKDLVDVIAFMHAQFSSN